MKNSFLQYIPPSSTHHPEITLFVYPTLLERLCGDRPHKSVFRFMQKTANWVEYRADDKAQYYSVNKKNDAYLNLLFVRYQQYFFAHKIQVNTITAQIISEQARRNWFKRISTFFTWLISIFKGKIPTVINAVEMGLIHTTNIYGDGINMTGCRSFWMDNYGRTFRCNQLLDGGNDWAIDSIKKEYPEMFQNQTPA